MSLSGPDGRNRSRLVVITDEDDHYWVSIPSPGVVSWMDTCDLLMHLRSPCLDVEIVRAEDVNLRTSWAGVFVVYTSSEDPGGHYKAFLVSVLSALQEKGAILLPPLVLLQAHHNKALMEMLRIVWLPDDPMITLGSRVFSSHEGLTRELREVALPAFVKRTDGAGSVGVTRVSRQADLVRIGRRRMSSVDFRTRLRYLALQLKHPGWHAPSTRRRSIVVQTQVGELTGDFKVLRYGSRFYVLRRENRAGGSTASGSGRLRFDVEDFVEVAQLLEFAWAVASRIPSTTLSMDIAHHGGAFYLPEFQAVYFGPATMQGSSTHWVRTREGDFVKSSQQLSLEEVYASAVLQAIAELH